MADNLLVDWLNKQPKATLRKASTGNVQNVVNNNTASNMKTITTPTINKTTLNLRTAAQPVTVQQPVVNQVQTPQTPVLPQTNAGAGSVATAPTQPRFVGFPQQQQQQGKSVASFAKPMLYVPTATGEASRSNKKEENRFRTQETALLDLQGDLYKGGKILKESEIKRLYPEFKDNMSAIMEFQKEVLPIVKSGKGVSGEQISQFYNELIQPKNLIDTEKVKKDSERANKKLQSDIEKMNKVALENYDMLSPDGQKAVQYTLTIEGVIDSLRNNYRIVGGASDDDLLQYAMKNNPEIKQLADELDKLQLTQMDKATINGNTESIGVSIISGLQKMIRQASTAVGNFAAEQNELNQAFDNGEPNFFTTTFNKASEILQSSDKAITAGSRLLGGQNVNNTITSDGAEQKAVNQQMQNDLLDVAGGTLETIWGIGTAIFDYAKLTDAKKPTEWIEDKFQKGDQLLGKLFKGEVAQNIAGTDQTWLSPRYNSLDEQRQQDFREIATAGIFKVAHGAIRDTKINAKAGRDILADSVLRTWKDRGWSEFADTLKEKGIMDSNGRISDPVARRNAVKLIAKEFSKKFNDNLKNDLKQRDEVVKYEQGKAGVKPASESIKEIKEDLGKAGETIKEGVNVAKETGKKAGKSIETALNRGFEKSDAAIERGIDNLRNRVTKKPTEIKETQTEVKAPEQAGWSQPKKGVVSSVVGGVTNVANKVNEKVVDPLATKVAEGITSTTAPQDKLFKALNPSINVLSRKKGNYDTMRKSADRANELIVEYGETPTNSAEYYDAIQKTKQQIWNNGIKQGLDEYKYTTIDAADLVNPVREALREITQEPLESLKGDVKLLENELKSIEDKKIISLQAMEAKKQQINAILEYGLPPDASQIYEKGMRELNKQIGIQEDRMISEIPGQFQKFKRDYGALLAIQEDAQKLMIKDMKKKLGGNLIQNWSRIEGISKMGRSLTKGGVGFLEGAAQIILGESLGKVKDTNFLIQSGFEGLRQQYGPAKGKPEGVKIKKKPPTPRLEDKRTDVEKGKLLEVDKRTKSNREEGYKTKNSVTSEKTAVTEKKTEPKKEEIVEKKETPKAEKELETRVETKKPEPKQEPKKEEKTAITKKKEAPLEPKPGAYHRTAEDMRGFTEQEIKEEEGTVSDFDESKLSADERKTYNIIKDKGFTIEKYIDFPDAMTKLGEKTYVIRNDKTGKVYEIMGGLDYDDYISVEYNPQMGHMTKGKDIGAILDEINELTEGEQPKNAVTAKKSNVLGELPERADESTKKMAKWLDMTENGEINNEKLSEIKKEAKSANDVSVVEHEYGPMVEIKKTSSMGTEEKHMIRVNEPEIEKLKKDGVLKADEKENAFGLKEQKGSNRIKNFTNVVKKLIDKYGDDIQDNSILIEEEGYLPLEITHNPEKNELIVRHINLGYDDPAMRFQITEDGGLHVTGIKQAFMEQMMGNWDWSTDIKDTDELLHVRAVNLEDQFLGENTIDEDTGVMKEKKSEPEMYDGLPVEQDEGGKFVRKSVEGLPPIKQYIGESETPKTTTEVTGEKTAATETKIESKPKNKVTKQEPKQLSNDELLEKKGALTFTDDNLYSSYRYQYDGGTLEVDGAPIIEGTNVKYLGLPEGYTFLKNAIQKAVDSGDLNIKSGGEDITLNKDNFGYMEVHKGGDHYRIVIKESPDGKVLVNSGLGVFLNNNRDAIKDAQSVAKSENQNIIGKNNTLTTKNTTNDRNNETISGEENVGQSELSNSVSDVSANEGGRKRPVDKGAGTGGEKELSTNSNDISEHRAGLENGGGSEGKSIRTKGNNVITEKTVTQARDLNRDCVDILEKHEFSSNPADYTKEEIETLRQYEGRGGINDKSDSETQGALNQYYTKDNIIKAMWRLLDGYEHTDILEPSMGVGRFFMYAPEGSNLAGFEYDKIPGTIAKILYPNADIKIGDFQDNFMLGNLSMGDNYRGKKYDIVIGNPPYEERQGRQRALGEEPKITRFDDYFIKRGVDMLKPGGHLAFVTSSQFLRGADNYAKQKISQNAELIDAYRIPVGAFDRTGVETDIIVLRKKEGGGDASLLSASKRFDEHPEKILGEERDDVMGRFGPKKAVVGDLGAIDEIAKTRVGTDGQPATLKSEFTPMKEVKETKAEKPVTAKTIEAKEEKKTAPVKKFSDSDRKDWTEVKTKDDGTTETVTWGKSLNGVVFKGKGGPTGRMKVGKGGIDKYQKLLNANGRIGDPTIKLESDREGLNYIAGELEPNLLYASGQIPKKLEQLERDYNDGFIDEKQYNKQRDLLEQAMPQEIELQNIYFSPYTDWIMDFKTNEIESVWRSGKSVDEKASIRTLFKKYLREKMDSYPNIVYKNSKGEDVTANAGRVMLDIVSKTKDFPSSAYERVITLLPKEYNKFLKGPQLDTDTKARLQAEYNKTYNNYAPFDYGELGYTVDDISETFMGDKFNTSDVQARGIARILTTESMIIAHGVGQGKTIEGIIGAVASMQQGKARKALVVIPAGTKASRMQTVAQLFPNQEMVDLGSLAKGTGIRKKLVDMYGPDPRDWIQDGQLVFLEHSAVGRQISFKRDTLTELEQNLTDVMDSHFEVEKNIEDVKRQLDRADKDIEKSKEKGASAADLEKKQKKREELIGDIQKMGRTTENTLQDILDTYSNRGLPEDGIGKALELIDEDYDTFMNDMGEYLDHEINVGQAKINKAEALKVAQDIFNNERAIYMEDLGIDHLTVDEAHNFRNLFNKAIQNDDDGGSYHAGMQAKEGSKQAKNLYAMSQYVMSKNGGGNVILLTATPFINDPSEMYNMLSYVGKNGMMEMGVTSMDDFYDTFVGLENKLTPTASTSGVTYKNVMIGFNNTETLVKNLLDRYIDYEGESLKIVKPRLITNVARLKMSEEQAEIENLLEEQIDKNEFKDEWQGVSLMKKRKVNDRGEAAGAVLEGMQQANLNLISPYLTKYLKEKLPSLTWQEMLESSPKLQMVIDIIKRQRDMGIMRGTFIYMDQGKELHEKLKTAIEESIPGIKVGIINGDKKYADLTASEASKLGIEPEGARARQTAKKFSDGELDVLIGGANTKEGINLQGNGYHLIEVSQPRNMNDRTQLNGRMWRQGNLSNEVLDTLLLMENSSDIYRFELMARKEARWNILEQLAAYKRGEKVEDVVVEGQLDMNEEKLALFTDPEKKARVSITMEEADLKEQEAQTKGQISTIEKLIDLMSNWKNDYGWYRKLGDGVTRMDKLRDENDKPITTDILADNALEPLEQQVDYAWNEAMKKMQEYNERRPEKRTKAEMEKNIKNNSPYSYEAVEWKNLKDKLQQARSERNLVMRQTDALGINTVEGLSDFILELEQQLRGVKSKLEDVQNTFNDKVELFRRQAEENKANEMDKETILKDLEEDFKHQVTLKNKEELRNWIEVTKNLPKREQAKNKNAVTGGKNKYSWNAKEYVGQQATFDKPKNLITSNYQAYSESNPKPEIKYIGYTPKEIIKTKDGNTLTRIGYQDQFQKMNNTLKNIKKKVVDTEEQKSYWRRGDVNDILGENDYYNGLKTRLSNMILKFAERYDNEIIKAYKSDNPGKVPTGPEDFYNYINNYSYFSSADKEVKVEDEYVKAGAEHLFKTYNEGKTNVLGTDKNKVTTYAARSSRPSIRMNVEEREKKNSANVVVNPNGKQPPVNTKSKNGKKVVVNAKGEAAEFYHGTPNGGFEQFDMASRGTSNDLSGFGDFGKGFYFTTDAEEAKNYATLNKKVESKAPEVYKVNLYMNNPLDFRKYYDAKKEIDAVYRKSVDRQGNYLGSLNKQEQAELDNVFKKYGFADEDERNDFEDLIDSLGDNWGDWDMSARGYDGVIGVNGHGEERVVFDKDQIEIIGREKQEAKSVLSNDKNRVTSNAMRAYRPQITMKLDENGNPVKKNKSKSIDDRVNALADKKGITGNRLKKMKQLNKTVEKNKGFTTPEEREIYKLKNEIIMEYVIRKGLEINDLGKNTVVDIRQGKTRVHRHLSGNVYRKLKKKGYIKKRQ